MVNSPQFAFMSKTMKESWAGFHLLTDSMGIPAQHGVLSFTKKAAAVCPTLGVYNMATLTAYFGPAKSVMAMTSIVNPERTVDDKGKIKSGSRRYNAHILLEHDRGVISHVMCGFNYFDPYGHEAKGQSLHSIQIYGDHGQARVRRDGEPLPVVWPDTFDIKRCAPRETRSWKRCKIASPRRRTTFPGSSTWSTASAWRD